MDVRGTVVRRGGIITGGLVVRDISMGFNIEMIRWPCVSMRARIRVLCAGIFAYISYIYVTAIKIAHIRQRILLKGKWRWSFPFPPTGIYPMAPYWSFCFFVIHF